MANLFSVSFSFFSEKSFKSDIMEEHSVGAFYTPKDVKKFLIEIDRKRMNDIH